MSRIVGVPRELRKFFSATCGHMSVSLQVMFELYIVGLLVAAPRQRNVADIVALLVNAPSRANFARFFSEYWWDHEQVLREAVAQVLNVLKLRPGRKLYLLVDDTTIEKTGRHMAGLCKLRDHSQPYYFYGHNVVMLVVQVGNFAFPVDLRLYFSTEQCAKYRLPFRTKNELVAEMLRAFVRPAAARVVLLFDSWFLNPTVVNAAKQLGYPFISYLQSNRILRLNDGRKVKVEDYARQASYQQLRHRPRGRASEAVGHQTTVALASIGKVKLVLTRSRSHHGSITEKYLVTDQLSMPMVTVVQTYDQRWDIECTFRCLKQDVGLSDYQMRDLGAIVRHLFACTVGYLLLVWSQLSFQHSSFACLADVRRWIYQLVSRDCMVAVVRQARRGTKVETIMRKFAPIAR